MVSVAGAFSPFFGWRSGELGTGFQTFVVHGLDKHYRVVYIVDMETKTNRRNEMASTKTSLIAHLSDTERLILLQYAQEQRREFDRDDSVEDVLFSAFEKLETALRLSSDW